MQDPPASPAAPPRPARRRRVYLLAGLLLGATLLVAGFLYLSNAADRDLQRAMAEADAEDPGWRLADLDAQRAPVPDKDNSVLQVQTVRRLLPASWGSSPGYAELFGDLAPEVQLNAQRISALKAALEAVPQAREEARKLADMPAGYFAVRWSPDFVGTNLGPIQEAREVASFLRDDAFLRAQEKDADGALRSVRAAVNAGRSLGDTPTMIAQLVRIACVAVPVWNLERVLAQGEPSPAALLELQRLLEDEDRFPYLLVCARGERAGSNQCLLYMESNNSSLAKAAGSLGVGRSEPLLLFLQLPGEMKREHALLLRYMNQVVEAARLPGPEQKKELDHLEAPTRQQAPLVRLIAPAVGKVAGAAERQHAMLRCAVVALAAERYRQEHKRWPESIRTLVDAGYLNEAPLDPYDGAVLRLKRLPDGLAVYAVGPDGKDDGGTFDRKNPMADGTDLGLRLWDADKRRQPPWPPKSPEAPAESQPRGP
jgi:hypothetical protein